MSNQLYRVVETFWRSGVRVEIDIGCAWKTEREAKKELKELKNKTNVLTYSLQKKE